MGIFKADQVNGAFREFCPELDTVHTRFPMKSDRWLLFDETFQGEPTFIACKEDEGIRKNYVYCKQTPYGPGYVSIMCKVAYVNLYSRLMKDGPPNKFNFFDFKSDRVGAKELWDTARLVTYARSRMSKSDDEDVLIKQHKYQYRNLPWETNVTATKLK